jgi:hypothetical protein
MLQDIHDAIFGVKFREFSARLILSLVYEVIHVYQVD